MSLFSSSRGMRASQPGQNIPGSNWNPTSIVKPMSQPAGRPPVQANPMAANVVNMPPPEQRSTNAQMASNTPIKEAPIPHPGIWQTQVRSANPQALPTMTREQVESNSNPSGTPPQIPFRELPGSPYNWANEQTFVDTLRQQLASGFMPDARTISIARQQFPGNQALLDAVTLASAGGGFEYGRRPEVTPPQPTFQEPYVYNPVAGTIYDRGQANPYMPQPDPVVQPQVAPTPEPARRYTVSAPGASKGASTQQRRPGNGIFTGR